MKNSLIAIDFSSVFYCFCHCVGRIWKPNSMFLLNHILFTVFSFSLHVPGKKKFLSKQFVQFSLMWLSSLYCFMKTLSIFMFFLHSPWYQFLSNDIRCIDLFWKGIFKIGMNGKKKIENEQLFFNEWMNERLQLLPLSFFIGSSEIVFIKKKFVDLKLYDFFFIHFYRSLILFLNNHNFRWGKKQFLCHWLR